MCIHIYYITQNHQCIACCLNGKLIKRSNKFETCDLPVLDVISAFIQQTYGSSRGFDGSSNRMLNDLSKSWHVMHCHCHTRNECCSILMYNVNNLQLQFFIMNLKPVVGIGNKLGHSTLQHDSAMTCFWWMILGITQVNRCSHLQLNTRMHWQLYNYRSNKHGTTLWNYDILSEVCKALHGNESWNTMNTRP